MAVKSQPHSEPWNVVTCSGVVLDTFPNARDAFREARKLASRARAMGYSIPVSAVRA